MEIFFISLSGNLEHCILDKNPHNYEVNLKITYDDFRLSVLKRKSVLDVTEGDKYEQKGEKVINEERAIKEEEVYKFLNVGEEVLKCFENAIRQRLTQRNSEIILGTHRITYFYSESLMAMPDYLYDPPVSSFPLLIGIDVEKMLMIH